MPVLTTVVGHTTITKTRILAAFDGATGRKARLAFSQGGAVRVLDSPIRVAEPFGLVLFEVDGLEGGKLRYAVADYPDGQPAPDGAMLLEGASAKSFRLQPQGPPRIVLVSCNDITAGALQKQQRGAMWRRLKKLVDSGEVDLIVHAGDQIYGDGFPKGMKQGEGRLEAYRRHYVNTWSTPDVAAVLGSCPNVMMWDDHEIYDGYGSNDNDGTEQAQQRFRAAQQAFREFQDPLNPPDRLAGGFGWITRYNDVGIVALDGRTRRRWATGEILGAEQLESLELELGKLNNLRHLFVVVGTPPVYIPLIAAEKLATALGLEGLDDIRDGWTASNNREECRRLLMRLLNFAGFSPQTMVTIITGDIHIGSIAQIDTRLPFGPQKLHPRLYQVTSSGIARPAPSGVAATLLSAISGGGTQQLFNADIQGALLKVSGADRPHCIAHRNFAVLDPSDGEGNLDKFGNLRVRFHSEQTGAPVLQQLLPKI